MINKLFIKELLKLLKFKYIEILFNRIDIVILLENVRKILVFFSCLNFENVYLLLDSVCYSLIGIIKENFEDIVFYLLILRNSSVWIINICVVILLIKFRIGLLNYLLGVIFFFFKD